MIYLPQSGHEPPERHLIIDTDFHLRLNNLLITNIILTLKILK